MTNVNTDSPCSWEVRWNSWWNMYEGIIRTKNGTEIRTNYFYRETEAREFVMLYIRSVNGTTD